MAAPGGHASGGSWGRAYPARPARSMPQRKRAAHPASGSAWGRRRGRGDRQYQNCLPLACCGGLREAREDIAPALFRAGEVARGGQVDRTGDVYMAEDQVLVEKPLWRSSRGCRA